MQIEIHRDGSAFKVLAVESRGTKVSVLEAGLADFGEARRRALSAAHHTGWMIFNRVEASAGDRPFAGTAR